MKKKIIKAVLEVMSDAKISEDLETAMWNSIDESTKIYGTGSPLDSLDFLRFCMLIEEKINDLFDIHITIMSDKAFALHHNPFRDANSLADFIIDVINEENETL